MGNYDVYGAYMNAAWTASSGVGEDMLRLASLQSALESLNLYHSNPGRKPLNWPDAQLGIGTTPAQFGTLMHAAWTDPTVWSDGALGSYGLGLSIYNNAAYMSSINDTHPIIDAYNSGKFKYKIDGSNPYSVMADFDKFISNLNALNAAAGGTYTPGSSVVAGGSVINYKDKSDKGKFNNTVALIKAYGEKTETSYDEQISKIIRDMKGDYKKGLAELKKLMNDFDTDTLYEVVKDIHHKEYDDRQTKAKTISDAWANKIAGSTDGDYKVNTSGLTADNVLDVLGTYITNSNFNIGGMWKHLISNNFDKISKALYAKAEKMKSDGITDSEKQQIASAVSALKSAADKDKPAKAFALFSAMRSAEASKNDKNIYNKYASEVPSAKRKSHVETYEGSKHNEEKQAYNSQRNLNTSG